LDKLLPERNFLEHGNIFVESFDDKKPNVCRVGVVRGDLNWSRKFDFGVHGDTVFTSEQIRQTIKLCNDLIAKLEKLRAGKEVITPPCLVAQSTDLEGLDVLAWFWIRL